MDIHKALLEYKPCNEQEARDRELMLSAVEHFPDVLTRKNVICHFTGSNWITNAARDKILFAWHNIYRHWGWTGGHADGESDLRAVARREAGEETGLWDLKPLYDGIFSIQCLPVEHHYKHGLYVSSHLHMDFCYLWEADEHAALHGKADENSGVQWFPIDAVNEIAGEAVMEMVYTKLNEKLKALG